MLTLIFKKLHINLQTYLHVKLHKKFICVITEKEW